MKTYLAVNVACGYYILRNFADRKTRQVKVLAKRLTGFWLGHINQALTSWSRLVISSFLTSFAQAIQKLCCFIL